MLDGLRQELPNAQLVYYNVFDAVLDMINNPSKYGESLGYMEVLRKVIFAGY